MLEKIINMVMWSSRAREHLYICGQGPGLERCRDSSNISASLYTPQIFIDIIIQLQPSYLISSDQPGNVSLPGQECQILGLLIQNW